MHSVEGFTVKMSSDDTESVIYCDTSTSFPSNLIFAYDHISDLFLVITNRLCVWISLSLVGVSGFACFALGDGTYGSLTRWGFRLHLSVNFDVGIMTQRFRLSQGARPEGPVEGAARTLFGQ